MAKPFGVPWDRENFGTLQVLAAVKAAREAKMTAQIGPGFDK
jgi:hypothetical protein